VIGEDRYQAMRVRDQARRRQQEEERRAEALDVATTPQERSTAWHALTLAAERFDLDAKVATETGHPRLAEQFERQAKDSRALADRMSP
jgi:hypothetical protein